MTNPYPITRAVVVRADGAEDVLTPLVGGRLRLKVPAPHLGPGDLDVHEILDNEVLWVANYPADTWRGFRIEERAIPEKAETRRKVAPLLPGDRVRGYCGSEGVLVETGYRDGGDCMVRWESGPMGRFGHLGARLAHLERA